MKTLWLASALLANGLCFAPMAQAQTSWPIFNGKSQSAQPLSIDSERGVLTIAPVIERTAPAVVDIHVSATAKARANPFAGDEFLERFFGDRIPDMGGNGQGRVMQSAGSGIIIDSGSGYVLTNHHVVDGADRIEVVLQDRRETEAKLVGTDPATDIALLKIDLKNLKDVKFADSDTVKVGDYVIAIGNAFGIGQTVTSGIVSAVGRQDVTRGNSYQDFIQTDAAINKGNSGGALINSRGELIGMNSAILSRSGGSNGIGFAVPTNMIDAVLDQLKTHGEVRRGRIGVTIQNITPEMMEAMDLNSLNGALVSSVVEDGPADKAGLKAGDVIVAFNGNAIQSSTDIRNEVGFVERGKRAELAYERGGKRYTTKITVEAAPDDEDSGSSRQSVANSSTDTYDAFNGATFSDISDDAEPYGGNNGVVITNIEAGSDAWNAGLRKGDIIRAVNNKDVKNLSEFKAATKSINKAVALTVQRGRNSIYIAVKK